MTTSLDETTMALLAALLEICAATGRSEGTVKAQVHRGHEQLQQQLAAADR